MVITKGRFAYLLVENVIYLSLSKDLWYANAYHIAGSGINEKEINWNFCLYVFVSQ